MSDPQIIKKFNDGKIILAFDTWSEKHNWWIPNSCPPDLIMDGKSVTPATHDFSWYKNTKLNDMNLTLTDWENSEPVRFEYLQMHENITFEHLPTLSNYSYILGYKYIYPIFITDHRYFVKHRDIGFNFVSNTAKEDIKNGRAKLVLLFPYEGYINLPNYDDINILNTWCIKEGFDKSSVFYMHGDCNVTLLDENLNFTYVPLHSFRQWIPTPKLGIVPFNPINHKNLFLSYTRRAHNHRLIYTCEILKHNLFNRGLISFGNGQKDSVNRVSQLNRTDLIEFAKTLDQLRPIELDVDLDVNNPIDPNLEHHMNTFMSVVLETHTNDSTLFFSEKIWKPISLGHPCMVLGGMNYLKELKCLGYKTFDQWIDEKYDSTPNYQERIRLIINELSRLSLMSVNELTQMRIEMTEVLQHNQNNFIKERNLDSHGKSSDHFLYSEIEKIWNSF